MNRQILNYVGDDGEFRLSIDEYAEEMLAGDFADYDDGYIYDPAFDLLVYRYPFHGSLWQRWQQYREYHALIRQLPREFVHDLSWLARYTWGIRRPSSLLVSIGFYVLIPFLCLFGVIVASSDEGWLIIHDEEVLSDTVTYQACDAYPDTDVNTIAVYQVTLNDVDKVNEIDATQLDKLAVRVPQEYSGWYQLDGEMIDPGANIVLAKYFDSLVCK